MVVTDRIEEGTAMKYAGELDISTLWEALSERDQSVVPRAATHRAGCPVTPAIRSKSLS